MNSKRTLIQSLAAIALLGLTGCYPDGGGSGPPSIEVQPDVKAVSVNSTTVFTASGRLDMSRAVWNLQPDSTPGLGSLAPAAGPTVAYTAPATPPIYPNDPDPLDQGHVGIRANVPRVGNSNDYGAASSWVAITAPTVTAGLSPAAVVVPLGSKQQFYGYAVGNANVSVSFLVNGIAGGSAASGTVTAQGVYTAPAAMPPSGSSITLTLVSVADPTKTASAAVTLR